MASPDTLELTSASGAAPRAMRLGAKKHSPKRPLQAYICYRKGADLWFLIFTTSAPRARQEAVDAAARHGSFVGDLFRDYAHWKAKRAPEYDEYARTAKRVIPAPEISEATLRFFEYSAQQTT